MSERSLRNSTIARAPVRGSPSPYAFAVQRAYPCHVPLPDVLELPLAINLLAVFFGALGGALRAGEDEHTDLVGVFTLAAAMGFGGGIVRDVLLGNLPPAAFRDPSYLVVASGAAGIGMLFLYYLRKLGPILWPIDTIVIGLFACVGTNAALIADLDLLPAIIIGMIASVGGLILSDLLQGRPSSIMYMGPPNALAGLAGSLAYALLYTGSQPVISIGLAVIATVLVRLAGPLFHLTVPQPRKHAYELRIKRRESSRTMSRLRRSSKRNVEPVE